MAKGNHLSAASVEMAPERPDKNDANDAERSAEEIRQDIAARRESITETVDRLSDRFQETFDWRTYVARHPLAAVGVAAGLGILVSGIFKHRPTPMERIQHALADSFEEFGGQFRSQLSGALPNTGISQTLKGAVSGFLLKSATEYLRERFLVSQEQELHETNHGPGYGVPKTGSQTMPRTRPLD